MYKLMETVGDKLLGLFVPRADAAAAGDPTPCSWYSYSSCWQCNYAPCYAYCCLGVGCAQTICR